MFLLESLHSKLFRLLIPALALIFFMQSSAWPFLTPQEEGICSPEAESSQDARTRLKNYLAVNQNAAHEGLRQTPKSCQLKGLQPPSVHDKTSYVPSTITKWLIYLFWVRMPLLCRGKMFR
jgi:hypothetical protein